MNQNQSIKAHFNELKNRTRDLLLKYFEAQATFRVTYNNWADVQNTWFELCDLSSNYGGYMKFAVRSKLEQPEANAEAVAYLLTLL
jgi:hypothetical protein